MADVFPHRYTLVSTLSSKLLDFEYIKDLYVEDKDFSNMYEACEHYTFQKFYKHEGFLLKDRKLCVFVCSLRKLLVREAHNGGFIGHFSVTNTLDIL